MRRNLRQSGGEKEDLMLFFIRNLLLILLFALASATSTYGACLFSESASGSCSSPRVIPGTPGQHVVLMDVAKATNIVPMSCSSSDAGHVVYFDLTPTVSGSVTVSTCHPMTAYDTVIDVMSGGSGCEWFTQVGCNDESTDSYCDSSCSGRPSKVTFNATAGTNYRIRVGSYNQNSAGCSLCLGLIVTIGDPCGEPPRDIVCQEAYELPGTAGSHEMTVAATDTPMNTQSWCASASHPVWFRFAPTIDGTATFTTCHAATSYDTVINVVSGCSDMATILACNDDMTGCGSNDQASEVSFAVNAGQEYSVAVGSYGNDDAGCLGVRLTIADEGCGSDGDCNDDNLCTEDHCVAGVCSNMPLGAGTSCPDDGNQCTGDVCDGDGFCTHPFTAAGNSCGDQSDTICTAPDTCDGAGHCLDNHAAFSSPCPDELFCNGEEACDGEGQCAAGSSPCGTDEICSEPGDRCDPDCNNNGISDLADLESGFSLDCNGNTVPDECDLDSDGDGVPDDCDLCAGFDDAIDTDSDSIPDGCDVCQGYDDALDMDSDSVPDGCDICPGYNDLLDADSDGVPDGCDECPGIDDHADIGLPFAISTGSQAARQPDIAFNSTNSTWLVVWMEDGIFSGTGRNMARVYDSSGTPLAPPFALSEAEDQTTGPRVSYDPVNNEWLVVWASNDSIESSGWRIEACRISATGVVLGTRPLVVSTNGVDEANPDVAAGFYQPEGEAPHPYFLVVWEDVRLGKKRIFVANIQADSQSASRLVVIGSSFPLDDSASFPANHESFSPRISDPSPLSQTTAMPPDTSMASTVHQVVFEVAHDGRSDIYLADISSPDVRSVVRITDTPSYLDDEEIPSIIYNPALERGLIVFLRGSLVYGQYLSLVAPLSSPALIGKEFLLSSADSFALDSHPLNERMFLALHIAAGMQGFRLAGQTTDVLFGFMGSLDQPALSLNSNTGECYLLVNRVPGLIGGGEDTLVGRLHCGCWQKNNQAPVADAGTDQLHVVEGTVFHLDGSGSSDPDNDNLFYRWTQTSGKSAPFTTLGGESISSPDLIAPVLDEGQTSEALTFELAVDDFRGSTLFPVVDTVQVTVVPGSDPHPPTAVAGPDQTVDEESFVQLDGCSSSDPDHDPLSYVWQLDSAPAGIQVALSDATSCHPSFTAPKFSQAGGINLVFKLRINTPSGGVDEDTISIHVNDTINEWPTADAGDDWSTVDNSSFTLWGSATDPNGDPLGCQWSVLSYLDAGEHAIFRSPSNECTPLISVSVRRDRDIVLRLTVDDNRGGIDTDDVTLHVKSSPIFVGDWSPKNGSPGTKVTIDGYDLLSVTQVSFNGYSATIEPETQTDEHITVVVPAGGKLMAPYFQAGKKLGYLKLWDYPEVTTGPLVVQGENNAIWTSPSDFVVSHAKLHRVVLSQGVHSYDLVRGKNTILQVQLRTSEPGPAPNAGITDAICYVTPDSGTPFTVKPAHVPSQALPSTGNLDSINQGINFFLPPDKLTAESYQFRVIIYNNGREILGFESTRDSVEFAEVIRPRILIRPVVPFENGKVKPGYNWNEWKKHYFETATTYRRVYPVSDVDLVISPTSWSGAPILEPDGKIYFDNWNIFHYGGGMIAGMLNMGICLCDYNDGNTDRRAMSVVAMIDDDLFNTTSRTIGFGIPPRSMVSHIAKWYLTEEIPVVGPVLDVLNDIVGTLTCGLTLGLLCPDPIESMVKSIFLPFDILGVPVDGRVSFVFLIPEKSGSTFAHEAGHLLGFVDPYSQNHDSENPSHCKYDEGASFLHYTDAPAVHQYTLAQPIFNVEPPGIVLSGADGINAKSIMSYANGRSDRNVLLLPAEYNSIRQRFRVPAGAKNAQTTGAGDGVSIEGAADGKAIRINGYIDLESGTAGVLESRPLPAGAVDSMILPDSALTLAFLDGSGNVLREDGFAFNIPSLLQAHQQPPYPAQYATFTVVRIAPPGSESVEIRFQGETAWTRAISSNPPVVTLVSPSGGETLDADAEFTIQWSATDQDVDDLTYSVYYSVDGGATYVPLDTALTATSLNWVTVTAPGSNTAVIKVEASDGFNLGQAVSPPFTVAEKDPLLAIISPADGSRLPATAAVNFEGAGYDVADGVLRQQSAFQWSSSIDGLLGEGKSLTANDLRIGSHQITLTVTNDNGRQATSAIGITILSDRDNDQIPDEVEEAEPLLDPDNPDDAMSDADGDGIVLSSEVLVFHTDPTDPDSDGDGISDGDEIILGTSPSNADLDSDGIVDGSDNCPMTTNPDQADLDNDGIGDFCDNCLSSSNSDQIDDDFDGVGNACDPCPDSDPSLPIRADGCNFGVSGSAPLPDLQAVKKNDCGGAVLSGESFTWTVTIVNNGWPATFSDGQSIFRDDLPPGQKYGPVTVANVNNIVNSSNISCVEVASSINCTADGEDVTLGAFTASFDVMIKVTPRGSGILRNPVSGGLCRVDPGRIVTENDRSNNDCDDTVRAPFPWHLFLRKAVYER